MSRRAICRDGRSHARGVAQRRGLRDGHTSASGISACGRTTRRDIRRITASTSHFGLPHSNDMDPIGPASEGRGRQGRSGPEVVERAALRRRETHRAARRPDHAHAPLHRGGGEVHPREKGRAVLPLLPAHVPAHAAVRVGEIPRQKPARALRRRGRGTRLERRPGARRAARGGRREEHVRLLHQRQRPVAHPRASRAAARGCCATARARRGKAACACRASRGCRARFPPAASAAKSRTTMDLFTTCATWPAQSCPRDRPIDGLDITPLLTGTGTVERDAVLLLPRHARSSPRGSGSGRRTSSRSRPTARRSPSRTTRRCSSTCGGPRRVPQRRRAERRCDRADRRPPWSVIGRRSRRSRINWRPLWRRNAHERAKNHSLLLLMNLNLLFRE